MEDNLSEKVSAVLNEIADQKRNRKLARVLALLIGCAVVSAITAVLVHSIL